MVRSKAEMAAGGTKLTKGARGAKHAKYTKDTKDTNDNKHGKAAKRKLPAKTATNSTRPKKKFEEKINIMFKPIDELIDFLQTAEILMYRPGELEYERSVATQIYYTATQDRKSSCSQRMLLKFSTCLPSKAIEDTDDDQEWRAQLLGLLSYRCGSLITWEDKFMQRDMRGYLQTFKNRIRPFDMAGCAAYVNFPDSSLKPGDHETAYYGKNRDKLRYIKELMQLDEANRAAEEQDESDNLSSDTESVNEETLTDAMAARHWKTGSQFIILIVTAVFQMFHKGCEGALLKEHSETPEGVALCKLENQRYKDRTLCACLAGSLWSAGVFDAKSSESGLYEEENSLDGSQTRDHWLKITKEAYPEYVRLYQDQQRLREDGSFVRRVSAALAKLKGMKRLEVNDGSLGRGRFDPYSEDKGSKEDLMRVLLSPRVWEQPLLDSLPYQLDQLARANLEPTEVLFSLLQSVGDAWNWIDNFCIDITPMHDYTLLTTTTQERKDITCSVQKLKTFQFKSNRCSDLWPYDESPAAHIGDASGMG
ncbi:hypothetical protein TruAng_005054 [Truncatella angustata]|nr:hypothetical protein TruAng_005054 [Truncatella angustata]